MPASRILKIKTLLDAADGSSRSTIRYIPVDISESAIIEASKDLIRRYPELQVLGKLADFTCQPDVLRTERPAMFCFLGSTIGNMSGDESVSFLREITVNLKLDDRLLIGFDMVKSRADMEAAYNDSRGITADFNRNILKGITADFNRNILKVINNELNADFNPSHFNHLAFFNEDESRIEMHLIANRDTVVNCGLIDMEVEFKEGEAIHTENSRKFTAANIEDMTCRAGLSIHDWYSDSDNWFSLVLMGH
jgi:L-histidine N-alpha-methyltransferase